MNEVLKPFDLDKCPKSLLGEELEALMKEIVSALGRLRLVLVTLQVPPGDINHCCYPVDVSSHLIF